MKPPRLVAAAAATAAGAIGMPITLVIAVVVIVIVAAGGGGGVNAATVAASPVSPAAAGCDLPAGPESAWPGPPAPDFSPAQTTHADTIRQVARQRGMGDTGATIGIAVALAESSLRNLANDGTSTLRGYFTDGHRQLKAAERALARQSMNYPNDGAAANLDSIGLFQQRPSANWGTTAELINPATAAAKFFDRLKAVPGWNTTATPWQAGQTVQGSPSSDGAIYQTQYHRAQQLITFLNSQPGAATPTTASGPLMSPPPATPPAIGTAGPTAAAAAVGCTAPGAATTSRATVTIPNKPDVDEHLRGKTIPTPNAKVAKGIAAGLAYLGAPYVWGGGGDGAGPNDGCQRGGGQLNSCQGLRGFDCSGLSAYVIVQAAYPSPGGSSSEQAKADHHVDESQGQAGDLVLFTGHVAVFLGIIDGTPYILQASTVGVPIEVVPLTRTRGRLEGFYRYWT